MPTANEYKESLAEICKANGLPNAEINMVWQVPPSDRLDGPKMWFAECSYAAHTPWKGKGTLLQAMHAIRSEFRVTQPQCGLFMGGSFDANRVGQMMTLLKAAQEHAEGDEIPLFQGFMDKLEPMVNG
jgi:hypothetical protein